MFLFSLILVGACGGGKTPTNAGSGESTRVAGTAETSTQTSGTGESADGVTVECWLDDERMEVTCQALGSREHNFSWTSNATSRSARGHNFAFPIENLVATILVELELCKGSACESITTSIDASHLVSDESTDSSDTSAQTSGTGESADGVTVECSLDDEQMEVACQAYGYAGGTTFSWTSNATSRSAGGHNFVFSIETVVATILVEAELCQGSSCALITTSIDAPNIRVAANYSLQESYSQGKCDPNGATVLESPPADPSTITLIEPMGSMHGNHITPIDHIYVKHRPDKPWDIYAMADGHIVKIGWNNGTQYRMIIEHSCALYTIYIHIQQLPEEIEAAAGLSPSDRGKDSQVWTRIPVKAGEVVGYDVVDGTCDYCRPQNGSLDVSVVDTRVTLEGFVNLDTYAGEFWKQHCVDPFDYWQGTFKNELLKKTLIVNNNPPGGKIDYDIDGRLVGSWFEEGTGGYSGLSSGSDIHGMSGHLHFGYSNLVADTRLVSFGMYSDIGPRQYHFEGDAPDPADISVDSGKVKYRLLALDHGEEGDEPGYIVASTGEKWFVNTYPEGGVVTAVYREVVGVVLVEMLNDRTIKVEEFPKVRNLDDVSDFTENARIYKR